MPSKLTIRVYQVVDKWWKIHLYSPVIGEYWMHLGEKRTKREALKVAKQLQALFVDPPEIEVLD